MIFLNGCVTAGRAEAERQGKNPYEISEETLSELGKRAQLGQETAAAHMEEFWEPNFLAFDANDLLGMLHIWQFANIADNSLFNGDFAAACGA